MVMNSSAFGSAMCPIERSVSDIKEEFANDTEMQNCITAIESNMNEMRKIFSARYGKHSN